MPVLHVYKLARTLLRILSCHSLPDDGDVKVIASCIDLFEFAINCDYKFNCVT